MNSDIPIKLDHQPGKFRIFDPKQNKCKYMKYIKIHFSTSNILTTIYYLLSTTCSTYTYQKIFMKKASPLKHARESY